MSTKDFNSSRLLAYRGAKGKVLAAISLLIPFGTVAFFILYCLNNENYALSASVEIGQMQFIALVIHGLYFLILPFSFELMIEKLPFPGSPEKYRFGKKQSLLWVCV